MDGALTLNKGVTATGIVTARAAVTGELCPGWAALGPYRHLTAQQLAATRASSRASSQGAPHEPAAALASRDCV